MRSFTQSLTLAAALLTSTAVAVNPVSVKGQDFVDSSTGKRFMIVGVDYQPGGQSGYKPADGKDPLTDKDICLRDAINIQKLGANTIRVYNVDPKLNHDDCASIFNAAGIYMIVDVNGPASGESINRAEPWTSYHSGYLTRVFGVLENFMNYPNTLAFFSANEVMNDMDTGKINPQYIRAVQRDMKNYIKEHASRQIPVGYSAADVRDILEDTWAYMQCQNGDNSDSDFFGLNSYSWCGGDATFESAGYNTLVDMFNASSVPVFFSEYGCNAVTPRVFDEVAALYGDQMKSLSGGLVYEYSQEDSNYGLATINDNGTVSLRSDYDNLQKQYNKLDMAKIMSTDPSQTSITAPKCDASLITNSAFDTNFTLPAVCPDCDALIKNGVDSPTQGKIVEVKDTKCPNAIYGSSGGEVQDLKLNLLSNDASNAPNGQVISNPSSASSANSTASSAPSTSSTSSKSSASSKSSTSSTPSASSASSASLTNTTLTNTTAPFPVSNGTSPTLNEAAPSKNSTSSSASSTNSSASQVSSPESTSTTGSGVSSTNPSAAAASSSIPVQETSTATSKMASTCGLVAGLAFAMLML
ncbi:hypothetical protein P280DRAFT_417124 [Massarina eburnea CBS 473.64]|uniref:1,3-beta-glucanosyltransferase n=1 Tax=Massarina eburnea CBS 473.64 TaxID=1395130 RepID=A0A6A6SE75_9PLEO|nr:hypothetical protein P280DRAFT_417124 [Massarina eburnea CBS 473.64]